MKKIFEELVKLQSKSYSIYSNYPVACIVIDEKHNKFYGVNVENSSYGLCTCAERSAISSAVTFGSRKIVEAHIICGKNKKEFGTPCGACRQILSEFMDEESLVFIWNALGENQVFKIKELLPYTFNKSFFDKE